MTDTTATQGLTRTTLADNPRLMATYLRSLAEGVDRRMATQAYNQQRSQYRPFACLQVNTEVAYDANATVDEVVFDTVGKDTAGMADLSQDPRIITLTQTGWFCVGGHIQTTGFGSAASDTQLTVNAGGAGTGYATVRDGAISLVGVSVSYLVRVAVPNANTVRMTIGWNGASTSSITILRQATMWAYKVRDL